MTSTTFVSLSDDYNIHMRHEVCDDVVNGDMTETYIEICSENILE